MKTKIFIRNETAWPTGAMRRYLTRIAREEFPATKPSNTKRSITVDIVYNRAGKTFNYCSGEAYLGGYWCKIRVPYPHPGKPFPVLDFCHVVGHEFGHMKGLKHEDMGLHYGNSCARGSYSGPHYDWALALPVPAIKVKAKPTTTEKRAKALAVARAAVERWTRKRKLADTKLKLWTRKVRRLEKTLELVELPAVACPPD